MLDPAGSCILESTEANGVVNSGTVEVAYMVSEQ